MHVNPKPSYLRTEDIHIVSYALEDPLSQAVTVSTRISIFVS